MRVPCIISVLLANIVFHTAILGAEVVSTEFLPEIALEAPEEKKQKEYLGLLGHEGEFILSDIKTDILVVELFSMYCPFCQKEAPLVNELFQLTQQQSNQGITIKIIGLGASNTIFEVEFFRELYDIEFPLFPDKSLEIYRRLGGEGTPGFIVCLFTQGERPKIVHRLSGGFNNAEEFLQLILEKADVEHLSPQK